MPPHTSDGAAAATTKRGGMGAAERAANYGEGGGERDPPTDSTTGPHERGRTRTNADDHRRSTTVTSRQARPRRSASCDPLPLDSQYHTVTITRPTRHHSIARWLARAPKPAAACTGGVKNEAAAIGERGEWKHSVLSPGRRSPWRGPWRA
jgi:hypothetical protein